MKRRDLWRRVVNLQSVNRSVERLNRFRPFVEPLEDRELLAAVAWTLDSDQSFITLSIPDQTINYNGTDVEAQFRNQTGSTSNPWTTNTTNITGQLATEYVDGSTIQFLTGQSSLTSLTSGNYRPNFAAFDAMQNPPTYTDTTTAPGEIGARLLGFGFVAAYLSISDLTYDAASATLPITADNFDANTTNFGAVTGTLGLDGVPIFLIGQLVPDSLDSLTSPLAGTNAAPTGSITSLGGLQRQLTLPLDIAVSFVPPGGTTPLSATITGQIVATGTAVPEASSMVAGRNIFYNQSFFDGNDPSINASDDAAIDTSKSAYLPSGTNATFANITGYDKGINGIVVDLTAGGNHAVISADDFVFKVGNNNTPQSWAAAPAPSAISVRLGAGSSGSDRVEITWANGAIAKTWLEVQVLATGDTGLGATDVFFWGNAVGGSGDGDTANVAPTNITDELGARNNPKGIGNFAPVTFAYDYNKDRNVNTTDQLLSRNNGTGIGTQLIKINIGTAGPFAPDGGGGVNFAADGDAAIASALAATLGDSDDPADLPACVAARLDNANLGKRVVAVDYQQLAIAAVLVAYGDADIDEAVAYDDGLIDSLSAELACHIGP